MTRKLTQEQAVTLSEWLGLSRRKRTLLNGEVIHTWHLEREDIGCLIEGEARRHYSRTLKDWFYSPEGQDALMDRILKGPSWIGVEIYIPPDAELQGQAFSATIRNVDQDEIIRCGKTRQEALIQACLQMAEMRGTEMTWLHYTTAFFCGFVVGYAVMCYKARKKMAELMELSEIKDGIYEELILGELINKKETD